MIYSYLKCSIRSPSNLDQPIFVSAAKYIIGGVNSNGPDSGDETFLVYYW